MRECLRAFVLAPALVCVRVWMCVCVIVTCERVGGLSAGAAGPESYEAYWAPVEARTRALVCVCRSVRCARRRACRCEGRCGR